MTRSLPVPSGTIAAAMLRWNLESFDSFPIGDGYEIDVNEVDYRKENEVCYDKNGVTVRHWPRSHTKDGAIAYRLDWNGLSLVWTGDGRPDELTAKYAKGVDVFVSECQNDLARLMSLKTGYPPAMYNSVMDQSHTPHYAVGYLLKQIKPRIGMVTHLEYEPELNNEVIAGVRVHWDGLFAIGAPDVVTRAKNDGNIPPSAAAFAVWASVNCHPSSEPRQAMTARAITIDPTIASRAMTTRSSTTVKPASSRLRKALMRSRPPASRPGSHGSARPACCPTARPR